MTTKNVEFLTIAGDKFKIKDIPKEAVVSLTRTEIGGEKANGLQVVMPDGMVIAYFSAVQSFLEDTLTIEKLTGSANFI